MYPPVLTEAGLPPEVLAQIDELIVGCGGFIREILTFTAGHSSVKDEAGQRVSAADLWVDQLLRDNLTRLIPGSSGYSEEIGPFGTRAEGLHVRWMLDPLDGTRPALLGGAFAVSAAAVVLDGAQVRAAVGWVYVPTLTALYRGILAPGYAESLRNGEPAAVESGLTAADLRNRYLAVNSDWQTSQVPGCPLKLYAPGATAVHLTQLVQPRSDVGAVFLSRYHPYDAAGGLVLAVAGGAKVRPALVEGKPRAADVEALDLLGSWCGREGEYVERYVVAAPEVLELIA